MELSNLSVSELRKLEEKIKQEMKKRERQDMVKAREQILAIAQSVGVPLKDLLASGARTKPATSEVQVRYRNPGDQSQQWTGRGRQPKWVKDWLGSGKSLDLLRV